jgi:hypothetical protein
MEDLRKLGRSWERAVSLFYPSRTDGALKESADTPDARLAVLVYALSGMVIFAIAVSTAFVSIEASNFAAETLSEITGEAPEYIDLSSLPPIAAYQFVLYVPFGIIINLLYEGLAFGLCRAAGGRGTLPQHLYASSVVWLAVSMSLVSSILIPISTLDPLPCLLFIALALMWLLSLLYLMVYMYARAYSAAHALPLLHAAVIALLLIVPRLAIWLFVTEQFASIAGLNDLIFTGA